MTDLLLIGIAAFAAGAAIAWLLRGSRAKADIAAAEAHLQSAGQQQAEKAQELAGLKIEHGRVQQTLSAESERRAAAEATAARLPALETSLAARAQELTEHKEKLAELEARLAEERKAADAKLALFDDAQQKLSDAFKALPNPSKRNSAPMHLPPTPWHVYRLCHTAVDLWRSRRTHRKAVRWISTGHSGMRS